LRKYITVSMFSKTRQLLYMYPTAVGTVAPATGVAMAVRVSLFF
jgi:hypothetical protein